MKRIYEAPLMETMWLTECDVLTLSIGDGYSKENSKKVNKSNEGNGDNISFQDLGF